MGLSTYKQIRFPACQGTFGNVTLVINRPGNQSLTQAATDTLLLGEGGEYYPFIVSGDFSLSKKFTTTRGRRALDDLNVGIRDGLSYTGKVNSIVVSEDFLSSFQTFFDVWFNETDPYKAFLLYHDNETGNDEVTHIGWIDPAYAPSSDAYILYPLTNQQIWLGTRTIKVTAIAQAQFSLTWQDVLKNISAVDCQDGTPYNGYMTVPKGLEGKIGTRADLFSSSPGALMQAVTYKQLDWTANPVFTKMPGMSFPPFAWTSIDNANGILEYRGTTGFGSGYVVGDVGTVTGGTTLAAYKVLAVDLSGGVTEYIIENTGAGYTAGGRNATVATSGVGINMGVDILKVGTQGLWGPSGLVFISLQTLFQKICDTIGITAPTVVSSLKFWKQISSGTAFPIDTANPISPGDMYISLNVFAKSHPSDGSYWDNPVGFSYNTPITEVLKSFCDMLLIDFNIVNASDGTQTLVLTPMGETGGTLPDWTLIGNPQQEEPATGARIVQVKYKADDLTIQSPVGIIGDSSTVEIPVRIHRIGKTSGTDILPDKECMLWDASKEPALQADECFKVQWFEANTGLTHIMPDCWKSLCYLYWYNSGASNPGVYPSNWDAFDGTSDWSDSFFVIDAVTRAKNPDGTPFTADANLQGQVVGNDYFNLRPYVAVAFAALTLPKPTVQSLTFYGLSDSTGSIQAVKAGLGKQWRFGSIASQNWTAIDISQLLLAGETTIKFQQYGDINGFPALTDLSYGPVNGTGGTTSTTGGATGGSTQATTNPKDVDYDFPVTSITLSSASTNNVSMLTALINQTQSVLVNNTHGAAVTITGIVAPSQNSTIIIYNAGAFDLTLDLNSISSSAANRINYSTTGTILSGGSALLIYDTVNSNWQVVNIFPVSSTGDPGWKDISVVDGANDNLAIGSDFVSIRLNDGGLTADYSVTGFTGGTSNREIVVWNNTPFYASLANQTGSSAPNQIVANIVPNRGLSTLVPSGWAILRYDDVGSFWNVVNIYPEPQDIISGTAVSSISEDAYGNLHYVIDNPVTSDATYPPVDGSNNNIDLPDDLTELIDSGSLTAAFTLSGIVAATGGVRRVIWNNTSFSMTVKNLATSSSGNQFRTQTGADITIAPNESLKIIYDDIVSKWVVENDSSSGLPSLANDKIWIGNGSNVATAQTVSGDATMSNTGALTLANTTVTLGSYGSATQVATFTVDFKGRLTAAANVTITGVTPGGAAGGDLSGTYPNPTVAKINGATLGSTTATSGNILVASGTSTWVSVAMTGDVTISNTGVSAIGAGKVQYSMIQNVGATKLLGNSTGSPAPPQDITLGTYLSFTGTTLNVDGASITSTLPKIGLIHAMIRGKVVS